MKYCLFLFTLFATSFSYAEQHVTWHNLMPETQTVEELSASNKALITEIYAYQLAKESRNLSHLEQDGYDQRVALAKRLGLDVEAQIKQRKENTADNNAVIKNLNIEDMKMGGFLVPLEMDGLVGTQFILVPTAGACIHTPPPPVNQTVLVNFPDGHELRSLYTPVWVKGNIHTQLLDHSVDLIDGSQAVKTGYVIDASNIKTYSE